MMNITAVYAAMMLVDSLTHNDLDQNGNSILRLNLLDLLFILISIAVLLLFIFRKWLEPYFRRQVYAGLLLTLFGPAIFFLLWKPFLDLNRIIH